LDTGALPADPQAQAKLMQTTGLLLRAMIEGLMRVLMGRTSFKNELHLEMTTIRSRENNPFKFSVDPENALAHLLFQPSRGFLPPWRRPARPSMTSSATRWQWSPVSARPSMPC